MRPAGGTPHPPAAKQQAQQLLGCSDSRHGTTLTMATPGTSSLGHLLPRRAQTTRGHGQPAPLSPFGGGWLDAGGGAGGHPEGHLEAAPPHTLLRFTASRCAPLPTHKWPLETPWPPPRLRKYHQARWALLMGGGWGSLHCFFLVWWVPGSHSLIDRVSKGRQSPD